MDSKNTKYDDITLMQYADGELDNSARLRLEKDLVNNKGLQNRLAVFALTRDDLINTKVKLPKHIEDLIDEQDRISNDEKITRFVAPIQQPNLGANDAAIEQDNIAVGFFKNYPVQSLAASVVFGLLIGSQGMKNLYLDPYGDTLINRPISEYQSVSKLNDTGVDENKFITAEVEAPSPTKQVLTRGLPPRVKDDSNNNAIKLLEILNKNTSTSKGNQTVKIVSEFKNTDNQRCKLAEINKSYLVACKNKSGNWSIHQTK